MVFQPTQSEKYANVNLDHFPKVRDEHQEYLKPISYTVVFTEGSSTNGELVVWGRHAVPYSHVIGFLENFLGK